MDAGRLILYSRSFLSGIYEFTFEDGSKTRGRYSYVYTFEKGEWKISNHHSSIMPEPAVAAMKRVAAMESAPESSSVKVTVSEPEDETVKLSHSAPTKDVTGAETEVVTN